MNGTQTKKVWFNVQNITKKPDRSTILCKFKREGTDKIDFSTVKVFVSRFPFCCNLTVFGCLCSQCSITALIMLFWYLVVGLYFSHLSVPP